MPATNFFTCEQSFAIYQVTLDHFEAIKQFQRMSELKKHNLGWLFLKYILVFFCIFLFEAIPLTGVLSMIFGGPLWLSLVVNVMLIHIAFTAFYPGSSRFRLLIPLTVYAAWQVGIAVTRATAIKDVHIYEASNRLSKPVPLETDIVFEDSNWQFSNDVALLSPRRRIFYRQRLLVVQEIPPSQNSSKFNCESSARLRGADHSFGPVEKKGTSASYCIDEVTSAINNPSLHVNQIRNNNYFISEGDYNTSYSISFLDNENHSYKIGNFRSGTLGLPPFTVLFAAGCFPKLGSGGLICGISAFPSSELMYFGADRERSFSLIETRAKAFVQMLDGELPP